MTPPSQVGPIPPLKCSGLATVFFHQEFMLRSGQCLCHGICQLQACLHRQNADAADPNPLPDVVVGHIDMLGAVRFTQSGGPSKSSTIVFKYFNILETICFECYI